MPSPAEDQQLLAAVARGDRGAAATLLRAYDALVRAGVAAFMQRWRKWRPERDDIYQEARIILLRAAKTHDPGRETFERHARALIASNLVDALPRASSLRRRREVYRRHAARWRAGEEVPGWAKDQLSLEGAAEDGRPLLEEQHAPGPSPEAAAATRELVALARAEMERLEPREADVLRRRYLLAEPEEQKAIAPSYGVSPARIGQIEDGALLHLRRRLRAGSGP